ncbi:uncharacterized protein LOC130648160 [Hydractinia symbiolongicarpus]|uniref:uncharacterized protein LOC130648160 n=1 Tax=Hydractinia symbiolongicarpus TaxID=13093 RepID=UPI00254D4590|nr:uncharacterized protein LOC130648160 [Hydractinia symbiolongicarpus]
MVTGVKAEVDGIIESQALINTEFEKQKTDLQNTKKQVHTLLNCDKKKAQEVINLNKQLTEQNHALTEARSLNDLEQYGRRNMVDVRGLSRIGKENTDQIILGLAEFMNVRMELGDIEISHRTSQDENAAKIVKFASRRIRDQFWENRKKTWDQTADVLGFEGSESYIYINESLTATNGSLFKTARDRLKKEKKK